VFKPAQRLLDINLSPFPRSELAEVASSGISLKLSGQPDPPEELSVVVPIGPPFLFLPIGPRVTNDADFLSGVVGTRGRKTGEGGGEGMEGV